MSKQKCGLTITFDIALFTPCTKYEANLDGLDFPINIPLSKDESRLLFGENATIADDYYQDLHFTQRDGLRDSIKQALSQNFELMDISGADDCWYSELDRYLNSTRFCGLEIEYR